MDRVGAYEAKTHLPKLLERVAGGECIVITKHGVPVAVLQPVERDRQSDPADIIAEIKILRHKHKLGGISLRELIEEGRS
ncbi:MAG: type II toxin-antitoxin system prevent-host-death family antitoxin [Deltaproteobacteria bacterium]|nr:type II toxin-antitoxin system prevent-host-death family antitoxin [Deltaproteobacteria bacterium]